MSTPAPSSGTNIKCIACHKPHGSPKSPITTSVVDSYGVVRMIDTASGVNPLCLGCHAASSATYSGEKTWALVKHSTVATSTKASATWPGAGQAAGECDNCHEPHGKAGDPKYTRATGVAACTTCHDAAGVSYPAGYSYRGGSAYAVSPHSTSGGVSWDVLHSDSEGFSAWESTSSMTPTTPGDPITATARRRTARAGRHLRAHGARDEHR